MMLMKLPFANERLLWHVLKDKAPAVRHRGPTFFKWASTLLVVNIVSDLEPKDFLSSFYGHMLQVNALCHYALLCECLSAFHYLS